MKDFAVFIMQCRAIYVILHKVITSFRITCFNLCKKMYLGKTQQVMSRAGEAPLRRLCREKLEKHRITYSVDIPQRSVLLKLSGIPCFPRGDLVDTGGS